MEIRQKQLMDLKLYVQDVEAEVTMILQSLQWDRKGLTQNGCMESCKYDINHRIPTHTKVEHEKQCLLKHLGYSKEDVLLPDPPDVNANTLVTLNKCDIQKIINAASNSDPSFRKGTGCDGTEPLTLGRLQTVYSADERRAVYDAVVKAVPSCHDLADLALPSSSGDDSKSAGTKSRLEVLAELRNMKRRRTKYRVAAKTRNYSDVLRDVIKTQMEIYTEVSETAIKPNIPHKADAEESKQDNHKINGNKLDKYKSEIYSRHKQKRDNRYDTSPKRYKEDQDGGDRNRYDNKAHDRNRDWRDRRKDKKDIHREKEKYDKRNLDNRNKYDNDREKKHHHIDEKYKKMYTNREDNKYYNERKKDPEESYYKSYKDRPSSRDSRQYDKSDYKYSRNKEIIKGEQKRYYDDAKEDDTSYRKKIRHK
ncbi:U11/U12 small nuclear ribonucleoprotein 48 kDa protein-like [Achroia grisella]|uniref:U11/U12 small nuclear ribonucleoprotein 48 kDa protein-like n=1 Tax=Achroia grisella TaxID=688607 RepID=UPI0027D2425E|nr:U11/U12 small nuclear ribonucleoprotein 48 kDa protein-like [Achroia grisella]